MWAIPYAEGPAAACAPAPSGEAPGMSAVSLLGVVQSGAASWVCQGTASSLMVEIP